MPPTVDPKVVRGELTLLNPATLHAQTCGYAAVEILKSSQLMLTADNFNALGDSTTYPAQTESLKGAVAAYAAFKAQILFRAAREREMWDAGTLGNPQFWAPAPDAGGGDGPGPGPSPKPSFPALMAMLKQAATENPSTALAWVADPANAADVAQLKAALGIGGPPTPPVPPTPKPGVMPGGPAPL